MTTKVTSSVLANTAVTTGTYGGTTQHSVVTVDAQGRITYAANATPSIANTQLTGVITSTQLASPLIGTSATPAIKLLNLSESSNVFASAPTSSINFYVNSGAVQYYTNNTSTNFTINFSFSSGTTLNSAMSVGDSISTTLIVTNGSSAYYPVSFTIDGAAVSPKWQNGSAITFGNATYLDIYTFVIIKTASSTYTMLAAQTPFK